MTQFVSYLRVSTKRQGYNGLGIEAQRAMVSAYIGGNELVKEFVEVESGTKGSDKERPVLTDATRLCRANGYTLVVAKIDRLYRNVYFTARLLESNIDFVCCDMPYADKFTIYLFAAVAEWEAKRISERTKDALAFVKKHGSKSGLPIGNLVGPKSFNKVAIGARYEKFRNDPLNKMAFELVKTLKERSISSKSIANRLNKAEFVRPNGKPFTPKDVNYLWRIYTSAAAERTIQEGREAKVKMKEEIKSEKFQQKRIQKQLEKC